MAPSKRKPTTAARKEEIAALQKELEALRAQWRRERCRLRGRPARPSSRETDNDDHDDHDDGGRSVIASAVASLRLRTAVHTQHLHFAGLAGLLNADQIAQQHTPLHIPLHLTNDAALRRETLLLCLPQKIADASSFILHRSRALDLRQPFSSREQFVDPASGDLCVVHFDITPFPGIESVSKVDDAIRYWANNMEICISELLGSVTIREDTDDDDSTQRGEATWFQRRLVSSEASGVTIEANEAIFRQALSEDEVLLAIQGVDTDELYPYHAGERVRLEVTGAIRICKPADDACVTMTRWATLRLHANSCSTPQQLQQVLTQSTSRWFDVVQRVILERVYQ